MRGNALKDSTPPRFAGSRKGPCPCRQWLRAKELGIQVGQDLEELLQLYEHMPEKVEHVLEIGAKHGGWLFMLASAIRPPARLCTVDQVHYPKFFVAQQELARLGFEVRHIISDAGEARLAVDEWLNGEKLDVLHLDAHHTLEGVREEWNLYSPLVRSGGIVAIHDVAPTGPHAKFGAKELFDELSKSNETYRDMSRRIETHLCRKTWREGLGIGVVRIP